MQIIEAKINAGPNGIKQNFSSSFLVSSNFLFLISSTTFFKDQIKTPTVTGKTKKKYDKARTPYERKSHGTNERRGEEKKPCVSERITRPHRITGKYPKIPKKALQSHEPRKHFMSFPPPSGEFFCTKMPTRYARCHFGAEKW